VALCRVHLVGGTSDQHPRTAARRATTGENTRRRRYPPLDKRSVETNDIDRAAKYHDDAITELIDTILRERKETETPVVSQFEFSQKRERLGVHAPSLG
jgi:hypothetical protein